MSANTLLITPTLFKTRTSVYSNVEDKFIEEAIKLAQDTKVMPALGSTLFEKLQTLIDAYNTSSSTGLGHADNVKYKYLIDRYLIDCLCHFVRAELVLSTSYQQTNKGVQGRRDANSETEPMPNLFKMSDRHSNDAQFYLDRVVKYLEQNYTDFPEFKYPGSGRDVVRPSESEYCPIMLD